MSETKAVCFTLYSISVVMGMLFAHDTTNIMAVGMIGCLGGMILLCALLVLS